MRRAFKVLMSIVVVGLVLMLIISIIEPVEATAKTERRDVEKEEPAAETKTAEDAQDIEEINGLITEDTMTKIGYEFYENFCALWKASEGTSEEVKGYNISISEKANPLWGSWIWVKVDIKITPTVVWSNIVRPRSEGVKEAAEKAVEATKNYLYRYQEFQEELGSSDMAGDGIY